MGEIKSPGNSNPDAKEYFDFKEVLHYFFRKKNQSKKTSINLRMMHGVNKISILIFLAAILYLVVRSFVA